MIQLSALPKLLVVNFNPSTELDVDYYLVHASQVSGFTPTATNLVNKGPETNITIPVPAAGMWYVRIAAVDTFGEDGLNYSDEHSISVPSSDIFDVTPPAAPGQITTSTTLAAGGATARIDVNWPANTDVDLAGYTVQHRSEIERWPLELQVETTSVTLDALVPGAVYEVRVAAFDMYGNTSSFTDWHAQRAAIQATTLTAPTGLEVHAGLRKLIINWDKSNLTSLARYEAHLSATADFDPNSATLIYSGTDTLLSYECTPGTRYYAKVRLVDLSGNCSVYSPQVSGTSSLIGTPDIAAGAVTADKVVTSELITVTAQIRNAIITSAKITDLEANKITTGTLAATTAITVGADGNNQVVLDGSAKAIKVTQGTIERVRLGKLASGAYGIDIKNDIGESIFTADGSLEGARVKNLAITENLAINGTITFGGTQVAFGGSRLDNQQVQVDASGKIQGIGTGAGTPVNNNNIVIGGRNLIKDSVFGSNYDPDPVTSNLSDPLLTSTAKSCTTTRWRITPFTIHTVGYYSLSFYLRVSSNASVSVDLCEQDKNTLNGTTAWQFFKLENLYVDSNYLNLFNGYLDFEVSSQVTIYLSHLKLEQGTKCTQYTPAPEDVQGQLNQLGTHIDANGVYTGILTGNLIQTTITANRGLKLDSSGLVGYDNAGNVKILMNSVTGYTEFNDVKVRGDVEATNLKANTIMVTSAHINNHEITVPKQWSLVDTIINAWSIAVINLTPLTLSVTPQSIIINVSIIIDNSDLRSGGIDVVLKKGSTIISTAYTYLVNGIGKGFVSFAGGDLSPQAGDNNYSIEITNGGNGAITISSYSTVVAQAGIR